MLDWSGCSERYLWSYHQPFWKAGLRLSVQQNDPVDHSVAEPSSTCDGNGALHSMCSGIYSDKTALCRHHLSGYSGSEGIADRKREELIIN